MVPNHKQEEQAGPVPGPNLEVKSGVGIKGWALRFVSLVQDLSLK